MLKYPHNIAPNTQILLSEIGLNNLVLPSNNQTIIDIRGGFESKGGSQVNHIHAVSLLIHLNQFELDHE